MSDQQVAELHERLTGGKSKKPPTIDQVFLRGWNAAIDWSIKQLKLTCDEVVEEPGEAAE